MDTQAILSIMIRTCTVQQLFSLERDIWIPVMMNYWIPGQIEFLSEWSLIMLSGSMVTHCYLLLLIG